MRDGYRTISQVAKYLKVHESTVRRWIDRKVLKAYQAFPGANFRIRVEDLADFERRSDTTRKKGRINANPS